jgi:hypothetical protein
MIQKELGQNSANLDASEDEEEEEKRRRKSSR